MTVIAFEPPETLTEDFSDDVTGESATQLYFGETWFETDEGTTGNNFKVSSGYYYNTPKSFKTKLRSSGGPKFWNYTLSNLESTVKWWEIQFTCGNTSEESNLLLNFTNNNSQNIAKIKLNYVHEGTRQPTDWVLEISFCNPGGGWTKLNTDYTGGYLYNGWYKLKIEENDLGNIDYTLYRNGIGVVDTETGVQLDASFSELASLKWENAYNPVICPMFFWDEHILGLIQS